MYTSYIHISVEVEPGKEERVAARLERGSCINERVTEAPEEPQRARERERSIDSFACTIARLVHGIYIGGDKRRKKSEKKEAISISAR